MFYKIEKFCTENARFVTDIGDYSLKDTLECGQCFRYEMCFTADGYTEYMTVVGDNVIRVGQRKVGELVRQTAVTCGKCIPRLFQRCGRNTEHFEFRNCREQLFNHRFIFAAFAVFPQKRCGFRKGSVH